MNYRRYKYIITNINSEIHLPNKLSNIPPQLWFITILYDYYYKGIIFYHIKKKEPIYHKEPFVLKNRYMKWKINPHFGSWELLQQTTISYLNSLWDGGSYNIHLSRKPWNLAMRYVMHLVDRQGTEGWTKEKSWFDISLIFSNLYNSTKKKIKLWRKSRTWRYIYWYRYFRIWYRL